MPGRTKAATWWASAWIVAWAVRCAQLNQRRGLVLCIALTIGCACTFLGIKYIEYAQKFHHHLVPSRNFDITYCVNNPARCEDLSPSELEVEREELAKALKADPNLNSHAQLYYSAYFGMTGLHALHMIIGAGLLLWLLKESLAGRFDAQYNNPVDIIGLYWHFVDIVWIYLFPLLYLIDRHK